MRKIVIKNEITISLLEVDIKKPILVQTYQGNWGYVIYNKASWRIFWLTTNIFGSFSVSSLHELIDYYSKESYTFYSDII